MYTYFVTGLLGLSFVFCSFSLSAQPVTGSLGNVIIGGVVPDRSAILELRSTTQGFLMPRMTETQRNSIAMPATGLVIYNTDSATIEYNIGTPTAPSWARILTDSNAGSIAWMLGGNVNTTPFDGVSGNFLGTHEATSLVIATDSTIAMTIDGNNQHVGIGMAPNNNYQLSAGNTSGQNTLRVVGRTNLAGNNSPLHVQNEEGTGQSDGESGQLLQSQGNGLTPRWTGDISLDSVTTGGLIVRDNTELQGDLVVDGTSIFNDSVTINGKLIVDSLCVTGPANFAGVTTFDSTVVFNDSLLVNGPAVFDSTVAYTNLPEAPAGGVDSVLVIDGNGSVLWIHRDDLISTTSVSTNTFDSLIVNELFTSDGISIFNDSVTINGKLIVDSLCVTGPSDFGDVAVFNDSVIANGPVYFSDTAIFDDPAFFNDSVSFTNPVSFVGVADAVVGNTLAGNPGIWELEVIGDVVAAGLIKAGSSLWIDGRTADNHQVVANDDLNVGTNSSDLLTFSTNSTTAVTVDVNQNVGIGVVPANRLHVLSISDPLRLEGLVEDNSLDSVIVVDGQGVVHWMSTDSLVANAITQWWDTTGGSGNSLMSVVPGANNSVVSTTEFAVIAGNSNTINGGADYSTISGGGFNSASAPNSAIGGGSLNQVSGAHAVIGGGFRNIANTFSTVGGGSRNEAINGATTIAGGSSNRASGNGATIVGGGT